MCETSASAAPALRLEPRVGLFVTCLVDIIRPTIGFAAVKLLEDAGCSVVVPAQTWRARPEKAPYRDRRLTLFLAILVHGRRNNAAVVQFW
jgi:hypothetical protein